MRLTNYIQFSKRDPKKLPPVKEAVFQFSHADRDNLMEFRKKTRLYEKKN